MRSSFPWPRPWRPLRPHRLLLARQSPSLRWRTCPTFIPLAWVRLPTPPSPLPFGSCFTRTPPSTLYCLSTCRFCWLIRSDFLGEWKRSVVPLRRQFLESHNSPFSHVVIDNFFTNETAEKLLEEFPHPDEALWHRYHNPLEKKLACNNLSLLRDTTRSVLRALNSLEVISLISDISGIDKLAADPYLHGGGLHCHLPAGKLDVHLDYSVHPLLPQFGTILSFCIITFILTRAERRLNLIVYLSKGWRDEYGGKIELWHSSMSHCVKK